MIVISDFLEEALMLHICLIVATLVFKRQNSFFRVIFYQLGFAVISYWGSYFIRVWQKNLAVGTLESSSVPNIYTTILFIFIFLGARYLLNLTKKGELIVFILSLLILVFMLFPSELTTWRLTEAGNNLWWANLYILGESLLLFLALNILLDNAFTKKIVQVGYMLIIVLFISHRFFSDIGSLANYPLLVEALVVVVAYLNYLYRLTQSDKTFKYQIEFWLMTGLALYFVCFGPYFSMFNFLEKQSPGLNTFLYDLIVEGILNNIRYVLTGVSLALLFKPLKTI